VERILTLWEARVRERIPAAADEHHPILINTLPAMLKQIAEALSEHHPRHNATEGNSLAQEHGGERVRVTGFRLEDIVTEYQVLRQVLFSVLEEKEPLSPSERNKLHVSLDESIGKACSAYVLVQEELREQLFATLAHDLRGPLSAAKVNAGLILRRPSGDNIPRWAARIADSLDRADRLVQNLLDALRIHAGGKLQLTLEERDFVEVVREAIEHQQMEHGERFVLVAPSSVRGHFEPDALRRAVENLLGNAVKYGTSTRAITLHVKELHERVFIAVHNHGGVIPREQQESLFHAFHRLPNAEMERKQGWGLELAQARSAAEAHGGSIGVDSLPELGTTFTIDIPRDARPYQKHRPVK